MKARKKVQRRGESVYVCRLLAGRDGIVEEGWREEERNKLYNYLPEEEDP